MIPLLYLDTGRQIKVAEADILSLQREVRQLKDLVDILTQDFKDVKEEFDGFRIRVDSMSSAVADLVIAILTEKN